MATLPGSRLLSGQFPVVWRLVAHPTFSQRQRTLWIHVQSTGDVELRNKERPFKQGVPWGVVFIGVKYILIYYVYYVDT